MRNLHNMKKMHSLFRWSMALIALWLVFCVLVGMIAVEAALHPGRRALGPNTEAQAQAVAARNHALLTDASITASDGAILRGWSIRPAQSNGDAVLLLHGQADNRAGMLGNADLLLRHRYAVLLPDARAHGASGGELATYGVKEADDLRQWFDWIKQTQGARCIDGLGESMGAAQLLESLRIESGFCAVVAESPFASFREVAYKRLGEKFHAGAWVGRTLLRPAVEAGFLYARWKYGVDFEQASPQDAVAASMVPVLLIHGQMDTNISPRQSEMILARNASRNPPVGLWEPAQAGHCGAYGAEPAKYERQLLGWFESHDAGMQAKSHVPLP
jgi:pimeloyl-ACP methyl ester carboxylesterase